MNDKEIRNATASILKEYMEWAGYITPSDFILIREQARKEIANGVRFNGECYTENEKTYKKQEIETNEPETTKTQIIKEIPKPISEPVKENKPQKEEITTKKQTPKENTNTKKEPAKEQKTVRTYEKKTEKSDFEILKGLKDEWN